MTLRLAKKFNLLIASNVLRQMSVKMGADSFIMAFDKVPIGTMLVGIDIS